MRSCSAAWRRSSAIRACSACWAAIRSCSARKAAWRWASACWATTRSCSACKAACRWASACCCACSAACRCASACFWASCCWSAWDKFSCWDASSAASWARRSRSARWISRIVSLCFATTAFVTVVFDTVNGAMDSCWITTGVRCTCVVCTCCLPSTGFSTVMGSVFRCTFIKLCIANVGSMTVFVSLLTTYWGWVWTCCWDCIGTTCCGTDCNGVTCWVCTGLTVAGCIT